MGSGDWFKTIISRKKTQQEKSKKSKDSASVQPNGSNLRIKARKNLRCNSSPCLKTSQVPDLLDENAAATRIQTAFRSYKARKTFHSLRGSERLKTFAKWSSVRKQASTTLNYLREWNKVQTLIAVRRHSMVEECRMRQKRHENQLKFEAKLHDLEVEWCGGSETREEILSRMQQREEAAVKRERAMAYAFSHQWRANSGGTIHGGNSTCELGRGNWSWSWAERWVAVRPWEPRPSLPSSTSPRKIQTRPTTTKNRKNNAEVAPAKPTAASDDKRPSKGPPVSSTKETML